MLQVKKHKFKYVSTKILRKGAKFDKEINVEQVQNITQLSHFLSQPSSSKQLVTLHTSK